MSFVEQIELFSAAEAVCMIHGSGLVNMIWSPRGCKVIELFADAYLAGDLEWISQCVDADFSFMIFPSNHKLDAIVDIGALRKHLQSRSLI
jgi:capsular polysaccharide biosynthesis protein